MKCFACKSAIDVKRYRGFYTEKSKRPNQVNLCRFHALVVDPYCMISQMPLLKVKDIKENENG